ncbi:MAG: DUF1427 family protein, partial [Microvirgula sp.]
MTAFTCAAAGRPVRGARLLAGEQVIPVGKQWLHGTAFRTASEQTRAIDHVPGQRPGHRVCFATGQAPEGKASMTTHSTADVILRNGRFTTLDP